MHRRWQLAADRCDADAGRVRFRVRRRRAARARRRRSRLAAGRRSRRGSCRSRPSGTTAARALRPVRGAHGPVGFRRGSGRWRPDASCRFSHHAGSAAPHPFIAIVTRLRTVLEVADDDLPRPPGTSARRGEPQRPPSARLRPPQTEPAAGHAQQSAVPMPEGHDEPARWQPRLPGMRRRRRRPTITGHSDSLIPPGPGPTWARSPKFAGAGALVRILRQLGCSFPRSRRRSPRGARSACPQQAGVLVGLEARHPHHDGSRMEAQPLLEELFARRRARAPGLRSRPGSRGRTCAPNAPARAGGPEDGLPDDKFPIPRQAEAVALAVAFCDRPLR